MPVFCFVYVTATETQLQLARNDKDEGQRQLADFSEREKNYVRKLTENQQNLSRLYDDVRVYEQEQTRLSEQSKQLVDKLYECEQNAKLSLSRNVTLERENGELKMKFNAATFELDREQRARDSRIADSVRTERQKFETQIRSQHSQELEASRKTISNLETQATAAQSKEEMLRKRIQALENALDGNRQTKTKVSFVLCSRWLIGIRD